jgi:hypothetical protein
MMTVLQEEITFLRSELTARTEEIPRRDHIIAGPVERVRELPATVETAAQETSQDSTPVTQRGDESARVGATPREAQGTQGLVWRRWWRRMTGDG